MFYSQTFLARKGPLSTVWIAAHLQHRLKKSHYTSTDIPSTVEHIMDPGIPIALRISGHLLLGVVRIYSKKVDYLFHDCNVVLNGLSKAFASIQITLPEDARQAPFHSITLPETFDLDALNMDFDEIDYDRADDLHSKSQEEITLPDRSPDIMDHYVAISFHEDIMMDSSHIEATQVESVEFLRRPNNDLNLGVSSLFPNLDVNDAEPSGQVRLGPNNDLNLEMDYIISPSPSRNVVGVEDHGPSIQRESPIIKNTGSDSHGLGPSDNSPPQAIEAEPIEFGCGLNNDLNLEMDKENVEDHSPSTQRGSPTIQHTGGDSHGLGPSGNNPPQVTQAESFDSLHGPNNDLNQENSPVFTNLGDNNAESNRDPDQTVNDKDRLDPSQQQFQPPTPVASQGGISDAQACADNHSPNFVRHESPPIQQPKQRGRKRKRTQSFDEPIVLTNKFMRRALNNPRDILRKRRDVPSSKLGTWKLNNSRRKENIFDQPMLTGFCKDLQDISKSEHVLSRPHLVISEVDYADARIATPPDAACDMEIEHCRNVVASPHPTIPAHGALECDYRSPDRQDDTMTSHRSGSVSIPSLTDIAFETPGACETMTVHTQDSDTCHLRSMDTMQDTDSVQHGFGNKELWFLEEDNYTPTSSQGTSGSINTLSERTSHVAQYLKGLSPITTILEEPAEDLSLNKILEGQTRKVSARMFFEVLVLKTHGLLDVQQGEPYDDISLKLAPT